MFGDRFTEFKHTYFGETKVFECLLVERSGPSEVIIAYLPKTSMEFSGTHFDVGSTSFGYFWKTRNYNVYHWIDSHGKTILYYFNICKETRILEDAVHWSDLIVDVVAKPGQAPVVFDEDEIPIDVNPGDLTIIEKTKEEILKRLTFVATELEERTSSFIGKLGRSEG